MRFRLSWRIALVAAFLNVLAPVLAYAVPAPAQQHGHHHAGMHHEPAGA